MLAVAHEAPSAHQASVAPYPIRGVRLRYSARLVAFPLPRRSSRSPWHAASGCVCGARHGELHDAADQHRTRIMGMSFLTPQVKAPKQPTPPAPPERSDAEIAAAAAE